VLVFSQDDPLQKFLKVRDTKTIEKKLTILGKKRYETEKTEILKILDAKFTIAPNLVMNMDLNQLASTIMPTGDNTQELEKLYAENKIAAVQAEKDFKKRKFIWNNNYLTGIEFNWERIIPNGEGCSFNTDYLTPVKNQLSCGSCWAFAAAATWEHSHKKVFGAFGYSINHNLSEEDLVNCGKMCNNGEDAGSCEKGGHTWKAFSYITCYKVAKEADYPYRGNDADCKVITKTYGAYGHNQLGSNVSFPTTEQIKVAINLYGAVTSYVFVGTGWYGYNTGVLNAISSGNTICQKSRTDPPYLCPDGINHAVTIVGWCDFKNAWIIKNSWGTQWGSYGGYAYVAYDTYNIGKYVYYIFPQF
jgi:C1A family cysteine protease